MPSVKSLAWMAGIAVAVYLGIDHYKSVKGGK